MTAAVVSVPFHGDTLFAVEREGAVFVALKPICERLGIAWHKQLERIKRDTVLCEGITVMGIPSPRGIQETTCLRLGLVNGWLFGINENRVRPEARAAVLVYKRECHRALAEHFGLAEAAAEPPPVLDQEAAEPALPAPDDDGEACSDGIGGLSERTVRLHVDLIREARLLFGPDAAMRLWRASPLPQPWPRVAGTGTAGGTRATRPNACPG
ncbi:hypothetical protein WCLP8_1880017 [uncultured Gammaproteobacteria bacterium]